MALKSTAANINLGNGLEFIDFPNKIIHHTHLLIDPLIVVALCTNASFHLSIDRVACSLS